MLRKIIESKTGPLTAAQFAEVMDLVTTDIKINNISFNKRTCLNEVVEIAGRCFLILRKVNVA